MQRPALTSGPTASTARSTTFSTFRIRSRPVSLARSYQNCANPRSSAPAASRPRASPLTISICAHWQSYRYTEEGLAEAVVLARQALAIDPAYAPAAVMVGSCRVRQRVQGWGALSADNVAEAVRLARQALEAERDDAETIWQAAFTLFHLAGEVAMAAAALDRALARNPNAAH